MKALLACHLVGLLIFAICPRSNAESRKPIVDWLVFYDDQLDRIETAARNPGYAPVQALEAVLVELVLLQGDRVDAARPFLIHRLGDRLTRPGRVGGSSSAALYAVASAYLHTRDPQILGHHESAMRRVISGIRDNFKNRRLTGNLWLSTSRVWGELGVLQAGRAFHQYSGKKDDWFAVMADESCQRLPGLCSHDLPRELIRVSTPDTELGELLRIIHVFQRAWIEPVWEERNPRIQLLAGFEDFHFPDGALVSIPPMRTVLGSLVQIDLLLDSRRGILQVKIDSEADPPGDWLLPGDVLGPWRAGGGDWSEELSATGKRLVPGSIRRFEVKLRP